MKKKQTGGTIIGFIFGVLVGLGAALVVAVYVTKVPVPFLNKGGVRGVDQDAAEAQKKQELGPELAAHRQRLCTKPCARAHTGGPGQRQRRGTGRRGHRCADSRQQARNGRCQARSKGRHQTRRLGRPAGRSGQGQVGGGGSV